MVEPGLRFGHNGGGPAYGASCFHFVQSGPTGCVLMRTEQDDQTMDELLSQIEAIA